MISFILVGFAVIAFLLISADAVTESDQQIIEQRVKSQMMDMIASYDIQAAIDAAVQQEMNARAYELNNLSIEETIGKLAVALQDRKRIEAMWPSAPVDDNLFAHLELDVDLKEGTVTAETAARDIRGDPLYAYLFDLKTLPAPQGAATQQQPLQTTAPQGNLQPARPYIPAG